MSGVHHLADIIVKPLVTEKGYELIQGKHGFGGGWFPFEVDIKATKPQIRKAIESAFGVNVERVNTAHKRGKFRRTRLIGRGGSTRASKVAMVRLRPGQTIDLF